MILKFIMTKSSDTLPEVYEWFSAEKIGNKTKRPVGFISRSIFFFCSYLQFFCNNLPPMKSMIGI